MKKINRIRNRKKVVVLLMALSLFTSYCLSTTTVSATPKQLQNELVESTKTVPLNDEPLESRVGGITYSYGTGPLYGKSSDYTVYKNTVSNPNLPLTKEIGSYSLTALGILLGKESTPAGIAATCVQTVYDKFYGTKTKGLSYKTKIFILMKNLKFIFILLIILNVIVTILGSAYLSIKQQAEFYRIVIHINVGIECLILLKTFKYLKENG